MIVDQFLCKNFHKMKLIQSNSKASLALSTSVELENGSALNWVDGFLQHLHVNLLQTDKRINADILIFRRKPPKPQNMPNVWNTTHFHMEKSAVTITSYYWGTGWLETEFLVPVKILQNRCEESTKMKKKIFFILHLQLGFYIE